MVPTRPCPGLKRGRGANLTRDFQRNGTTTWFPVLHTANGLVFGLCKEKHRHQVWLQFLSTINQTMLEEREIYLIYDNDAEHNISRSTLV